MAKILKRGDAVDIENVDEGVANNWRWQCVEKTVDVDLLKYPKTARLDTITICLKITSGKSINVEKLSACYVQRELEKLTSHKIPV